MNHHVVFTRFTEMDENLKILEEDCRDFQKYILEYLDKQAQPPASPTT